MTFIVGMNLSNRLYVAGDTRVTFSNGLFKDDIIKVVPLCGESIRDGQKAENAICVAVAGDLSLSNFFCHSMRFAIKSGELSSDIRSLFIEIPEFFRKKMDQWLKTNPYRSCCVIFGGMCVDRKKMISVQNLERLKDLFISNIAPQDELDAMKARLAKDPFFQEVARRMPKDRWKSPFEEPEAIIINPLIEQAIDKNQDFIEAPDSLIFSVQVSKKGICTEVAEWGEMLGYGTDGVSKNDLPEDFLAQMELSIGQIVNENDLMESMRVRNYILKVAKDKKIKEIGGTVTPMVLRDGLFIPKFGYRHGVPGGKILEMMYEKDGKLYFFKDGEPEIEMKWFTRYQDGSGQAQM